MASMHWLDYVIFVALLLISLGIGVYHGCTGGRQKTTKEFLLANRKLKVIPTVISLLVSFQSAIMILGFVSEMCTYGISFWPMYMLTTSFTMVIVERLFVPWLYPLKLTSVFEYFELRFRSRTVRVVASTLGILSAIIYMGLAMYAPTVALDYVSGLPLYVTAPIMGFVCVSYTASGGLRAVIWTDVSQCTVMFGGLLAIIVCGCIKVGGFGKIFSIANERGRIFWIPLDLDPRVRMTLWDSLFGYTLFSLSIYGVSQFSVQRYCAMSSLRDARKTVLMVIPGIFITASIVGVMGFVVFAYNTVTGCDPAANHEIATGNERFPHFIVKAFSESKGFCGLVLAILYSGALSSISSSLSAATANTWEDILKPWLTNITDFKAALLNKIIVIVYGAVSVAVVFIIDCIPGPIITVASQLLGAVGGPLLGMYLLGGVFRKMEKNGVVAGGLVGLAATTFVVWGSITVSGYHQTLSPTRTDACEPPINVTEVTGGVSLSGISNLYAMSFLWYTPFGISVTMITGLIVSYVIHSLFWNEANGEDIPENLFIPFAGAFRLRDNDDECASEESQHKDPSLIVEMTVAFDKEDGDSQGLKEFETTSLVRGDCQQRHYPYNV